MARAREIHDALLERSPRPFVCPLERPDVSDNDLMLALAGGHRNALDVLTRRHWDWAVREARRILPHGDGVDGAEDVVQAAFLKLWKHPPQWHQEAAFPTYMRAVLKNAAVNSLRRRRPQLRDPAAMRDVPTPEQPRNQQADVDRALQLREAIRLLPEGQREALEMRRDGSAYAAIAEALGCSTDAAEHLVRRAIAALRANFGGGGGGDILGKNERLTIFCGGFWVLKASR